MKQSRQAVATESVEQIAFFQWIRAAFPKVLAWHTPNGGKRSLKTAVRLKKEGTLAGVLDITIAKRSGIYAGMYIELKRTKGGSLSDSQKEMIEALRAEGYYVCVAKGWVEARDAFLHYLSFGEPILHG